MIRAHLLRWRPRLHAQRRETTPRVQPSGAASQLDPSHRSSPGVLRQAPSPSKSFAATRPIARMAGTLQNGDGTTGSWLLAGHGAPGRVPASGAGGAPGHGRAQERHGLGGPAAPRGRRRWGLLRRGGEADRAPQGLVEREGLARHADRRQAQRAVRPRPAPRRRPGSDHRPRCRRAHGLRDLAHSRGLSRQRPAEAGAGHCGGPRAQEAHRGEAGPGQRRPRRAPPSLLSVLHPDRRRDRRHPRVRDWSRGARRCACACRASRSPAHGSR